MVRWLTDRNTIWERFDANRDASVESSSDEDQSTAKNVDEGVGYAVVGTEGSSSEAKEIHKHQKPSRILPEAASGRGMGGVGAARSPSQSELQSIFQQSQKFPGKVAPTTTRSILKTGERRGLVPDGKGSQTRYMVFTLDCKGECIRAYIPYIDIVYTLTSQLLSDIMLPLVL